MALAKEKPLYGHPTDYEDDLHLWLYEQIELLRQKRIAEVDLPNVIEELETVARSHRNALRSSYRLVISHLLKWRFQPGMRTSSWEITIGRERQHIADEEEVSPSLRAHAEEMVRDVYRTALKEASIETGLPGSAFPAECPWTPSQLRDDEFVPE